MTFKNYLTEEKQILDEALITFGNKRPKYNQAVIIAGGAGSGKGFVIENLIGIEAKVLDVDQIKGLIIHPGTPKLNKKILDKYGIDVTKMDLRDSEAVRQLHQINDEMGISDKVQALFFKDMDRLAKKEMLPNVIFDSTMKSEKKLREITEILEVAGYKNENIHIVWVVNSVQKAVNQNKTRSRVVPEDILIQTHEMVAANISSLLKGNKIDKYIGGDMWLAFNQQYVDASLVFSEFGGKYIERALLVKIKPRGKRTMSFGEIADKFVHKIQRYIPKSVQKLWSKK